MDEPANRSAVRDRDRYVYVRVDDFPDPHPAWKNWWPEIDGPCSSVTWAELQARGPLEPVAPIRAARALDRVLREVD